MAQYTMYVVCKDCHAEIKGVGATIDDAAIDADRSLELHQITDHSPEPKGDDGDSQD